MKHLVKPECRHKCTFIQITDGLYLCPHASYGQASYYRGAVEEGRRLLERAGGYDVVLKKLAEEEEAGREKVRKERARRAKGVRYD
jgi:hypothetical protein